MTATTGHISTPTTYDVAFGRGVLMGILAAIVVTAALIAAVWLAGQFPIPAQGPSSLERPAPVQVDENHPVVRPGGVKVY
jgi:hypothetical protein